MVKWRSGAPLAVLLVVGAALRFELWRRTGVYLYGDMLRYDAMAQHLAFRGYLGFGSGPDAFVMPAYPVFLAFLYKLAAIWHGGHAVAHTRVIHEVFLIQQAISLGNVALAYALGRMLAGRWAGFGAGLLTLFYLPDGFIGLTLLTEAVFIPLLLATLAAFVRAEQTGRRGWYGLSGALLGLTTLARPTVLPMVAMFGVFAWMSRRGRREALWNMGWLFGALILVMSPWWIRNALDFHRLILLSTEAGNPMLAGATPYGRVNIDTLIAMARARHETQEHFAIQYILHGFSHHFLLYAGWFFVGKIPYLLWEPWFYAYLPWFVFAHRTLVVLGAAAMAWTLWNRRSRAISAASLYLLVVQFGFLPLPRYGFPTVAIWLILIPVALAQALNTVRKKKEYLAQ